MVALLDVSVLVALFDSGHRNHEAAHDWFDDHRHLGWATCPLTENGLLRVATSPTFANPPHRAVDVAARLASLRSGGHHHFWPAALSLTDDRIFNLTYVRGHRQLTDVYLVGVAKTQGGMLATFDRSIHLRAVKGATRDHLHVISAAPEESMPGGR
jgi:hypothetical protein